MSKDFLIKCVKRVRTGVEIEGENIRVERNDFIRAFYV